MPTIIYPVINRSMNDDEIYDARKYTVREALQLYGLDPSLTNLVWEAIDARFNVDRFRDQVGELLVWCIEKYVPEVTVSGFRLHAETPSHMFYELTVKQDTDSLMDLLEDSADLFNKEIADDLLLEDYIDIDDQQLRIVENLACEYTREYLRLREQGEEYLRVMGDRYKKTVKDAIDQIRRELADEIIEKISE